MALSMAQSAGSPYVTLTKTGVDGIYDVARTVAGVTTPVRGSLTVTAGTGTLVDREAPQGVLVSYTSGVDSTSGITSRAGSFLIHPTNSALDIKVQVSEYPTWGREVAEDVFQPLGGAPAIVISQPRRGRVGTVRLNVDSAAAVTALEAFLTSTRLALLSTYDYPAPYLWVAMGSESWTPMTRISDDPFWQVEIPLRETARPEVVSSDRVTWLDVAGRYATWNDLAAEYGTWEAFLADVPNWTA